MKILWFVLLIILTVIVTGLQSNAQEEKEEEIEVFFVVEEMPEYPGGNKALLKDITAKVKYPEEACKKGIAGKIYVSFVVGKTGIIENVGIARGVDPLLDKEALGVINKLDKTWKPGRYDRKPVNMPFTILFDFKKDGKIDVTIPTPKKRFNLVTI